MSYHNFEMPAYPCMEDVWDYLARERRPIVVYGMGNGADKLINRLSQYGVEIADFFASDGFVRGHSFHGKRVKSFSEIRAEYDDFVILLSFASNRPEVIEMLAEIDANYDMLVPDMPVAGENEYFDREFFNTHYDEIMRAYGSLADADSMAAFAAVVNYRLSGKMSYLLGAYSTKDELYSLICPNRIRACVDVGAYNGDTLAEAVKYFPALERATAIEPDPRNFKKLEKFISTLQSPDITVYNAAAFDKCTDGSFISSGNRNSSVSSTASFEHRMGEVRLLTVDSITDGEVDYVKYDVEGAEYEALLGSDSTICTHTPALLVSLYHRSRDIFSLTNYISDRYGRDYDLYMRRLYCLPAWELDLVAIPKKWNEK